MKMESEYGTLLAGYIAGKGVFHIDINKIHQTVQLSFYIIDKKAERQTFQSIVQFFRSGKIIELQDNKIKLRIGDSIGIKNIILLIDRHTLLTIKGKMFYATWKAIYNMKCEKQHKTVEGFDKIIEMKDTLYKNLGIEKRETKLYIPEKKEDGTTDNRYTFVTYND